MTERVGRRKKEKASASQLQCSPVRFTINSPALPQTRSQAGGGVRSESDAQRGLSLLGAMLLANPLTPAMTQGAPRCARRLRTKESSEYQSAVSGGGKTIPALAPPPPHAQPHNETL